MNLVATKRKIVMEKQKTMDEMYLECRLHKLGCFCYPCFRLDLDMVSSELLEKYPLPEPEHMSEEEFKKQLNSLG